MRDHADMATEERRGVTRSPAGGTRRPRHALLALQPAAGNAAVVQMLREAGHPWAEGTDQQDRYGGRAGGAAVQRAAGPATGERQKRPSPGQVTAPDLDLAAGQEVHSELDVPTRMLNRVARVMMGAHYADDGGLPLGRAGTPHLALTVIDGKVHIAGNTGMSQGKRDAALGRLTEALAGPGGHDEKKLAALLSGGYGKRHAETGDATAHAHLDAIKKAVADPESLTWHNTVKAPGPKQAKVHGEMALLDAVARSMRERPNPRPGELQDWPIGGRKRDCIACHWAHAVFNTHIANALGYRIVTSGSHGGFFPNWRMPAWMVDNAEAKAAMKQKVESSGHQVEDDVLLGITEKGSTHRLNPPHRGDEPYLSDSSEDEA
ncbi:nucleic acid/nucleotide deaminase domain-containing protein [Streptomyces sp. NPDC087270]|uniref:nucleic acid/nucleotide deaminase domain-containing protein n=1 Tax=Streptomyces sp. NPDC087270 TaxID=3365774 RepID=UPI00381D92C1